MKSLAVAVALIVCATTVQAKEVWTCSKKGDESKIMRFQLTESDFVQTAPDFGIGRLTEGFRILQNNEYGVVATASYSLGEEGKTAVGAFAVAINKRTKEFSFATLNTGATVTKGRHGLLVHGTCTKE